MKEMISYWLCGQWTEAEMTYNPLSIENLCQKEELRLRLKRNESKVDNSFCLRLRKVFQILDQMLGSSIMNSLLSHAIYNKASQSFRKCCIIVKIRFYDVASIELELLLPKTQKKLV